MHKYIDIHTHNKINNNIFKIVCSNSIDNKNSYYSVGIHPWNINNLNVDINIIKEKIRFNNVLAIGEIGLDRTINTKINFQKNVFYSQLKIAIEIKKPVIIHCVKAYSDFQQIIKENHYTYIFHGFNANLLIANYLINNGCYLSFGNKLLTNKKLQNTFKQLPTNKIFFETDESNINIKDIYIFAAKLLNIELFQLQNLIQNNFKTIFGIDVRKLV